MTEKRRRGRPKLPKHLLKKSATVRLSQEEIDRLPYLRSLDALVEAWAAESELASETSPRWEQMRKFLDKVKTL